MTLANDSALAELQKRSARTHARAPTSTPTAKNGGSTLLPSSNLRHQPTAVEQNAIGALLIHEQALTQARAVGVTEGDFESSDFAAIYRAIAHLAIDGRVPSVAEVSDHLNRTGPRIEGGWLALLSQLARETLLQPEHAAAGITALKDQALLRVIGVSDEGAARRVEQAIAARKALRTPPTPTIVLRQAADIITENREPEWLNGLHKIVERNVLGVIAGPRSTFKSFVALHWAMLAALKGEVVVILSAEGSGLGRRIEAWLHYQAPAVTVADLRVFALERPVNLNSAEVLEDLCTAIGVANLAPGLIIVDTLSKYAPGLDENDNAEVAGFLTTLSVGLRARYATTVLLVAHSGHADRKRPRGASALMANPDAEYIVDRPDPKGMACTVTRERFKDSQALPPLAYVAEVVDLKRVDRYQEPVTSLVMREIDPATVKPPAQPQELRAKTPRRLLSALRDRCPDGSQIWTITELREIARAEPPAGLGLAKSTAYDAVSTLTLDGRLNAVAPAGWKLP